MKRDRAARLMCLASLAWSAVFIPVELVIGAYGYALMQGGLQIAALVLLSYWAPSAEKARNALPAPVQDERHHSANQ